MKGQRPQRADRRRALRRRRNVIGIGVVIVAAVIVLVPWKGAPTWLLQTHRHVVLSLPWIKEHWLNAIAITAAATVAAAVVPLVISRQESRNSQPDTQRHDRERSAMLQTVRQKWIRGILEPSMIDDVRLTLGQQDQLQTRDLSMRIIRRPGPQPVPTAEGGTITRLVDAVGGGVLILGAPGGGKTTLLLQLADELLKRAENDPNGPIPVVLNLASWTGKYQPLTKWLEEELNVNYRVPRLTASAWVQQDALTLLLDGLERSLRTKPRSLRRSDQWLPT